MCAPRPNLAQLERGMGRHVDDGLSGDEQPSGQGQAEAGPGAGAPCFQLVGLPLRNGYSRGEQG